LTAHQPDEEFELRAEEGRALSRISFT